MATSEDSRLNGLLQTPSVEDAGRVGSAEAWRQYEEEGRTTQCRLRNQVAALTSSPAVSPVSPSLPQESEKERKMTASSGLRCEGLFPRSGPTGSWLRTSLESLNWHSSKCVLTWKSWATKSNRLLFQLAPSTRPTGGTECGSSRIDKVILLKTPSAVETEGGTMELREGANAHYKLRDQIAALLPTPAARDWKGARKPETLEAVGRLPSNDLESSLKAEPSQTGVEIGARLRLSPAFTEWMMGYPEGWLDFPTASREAIELFRVVKKAKSSSAKASGGKAPSKPMETP